MSAVRDWLETIGLGQYAHAFEANDIDMDLLAQIGHGSRAIEFLCSVAAPFSVPTRLRQGATHSKGRGWPLAATAPTGAAWV
jgi:hypothetical protein